MTLKNKEKQIKDLKGKISDTDLRKKIRQIYNVKKTQGNYIFNKIFEKSVAKSVKKNVFKNKVGGDLHVETINVEDLKTLEDLIKYCEIDQEEWIPAKFTSNIWDNKLQLKAEFKPKVEKKYKQIFEEFKLDYKNLSKKPFNYVYKNVTNANLLVMGIFDVHLGKLAWDEESGHNYDLKIAKELYFKTLYDLIEKAKKQGNINRILFPIGNDYLTCDSSKLTTTAGTPQDVDSRFAKIFREGRKILVEAVEILKELAPVDIIVVPGNHDRDSMFHLGDAIECWFHDDKTVNINNSPAPRKYYEYGNIMFGLTHGDTIKKEKLPLIGAVEQPEMWGRCKRKCWLTGHLHHIKMEDHSSVQIFILPSISGVDEYHNTNGYIGSNRCGVAMLYSKDGLEAVFQSEAIN
jgi:predicted phosphodiesterase